MSTTRGTSEEIDRVTYRTDHIDETTIIYAASYGAPDCDPEGTIIGFSPTDVDARVETNIRNSARYAAEQATIILPDGSERDAEPEDFPYGFTHAMEMPIGDIIRPTDSDWDDAMSMLKHYGYADISRA